MVIMAKMEMKPSILEIKHEINNILFKLETSRQILEEGKIREEELKNITQILKRNTDTLKQIFKSIYAVEKLEKGSYKKEEINLQPFFKKFLNIEIPKRKIEFSSEILYTAFENIKILNKFSHITINENKIILYIEKPKDRIDIFFMEVAKYIFEKAGIMLHEKENTDNR